MKRTIKLDKERELKFNFGSLRAISEVTGQSLNDVFKLIDPKNITAENITTIVYGGLKKYSPELTYEDVVNLIDEVPMSKVEGIVSNVTMSLIQSFTEDSKNVSPPKAKIPQKKKKKSGAGGGTSEKQKK